MSPRYRHIRRPGRGRRRAQSQPRLGSRPSGAGQAGFTLIEMLVVVMIVGLAALVVVTNLSTVYRRSETDGTVTELAAFLDSVPTIAQREHASVLLRWDEAHRSLTVTNEAGTRQLRAFTIPDGFTVTTNLASVLECDPVGRAFVAGSSTMLDAVQTLTVSHAGPNDGPTYTVQLSPLWAVVVEKHMG